MRTSFLFSAVRIPAAYGESLVIKRDGEIKEVPAKDLLKILPKE